jgi:hypothetical protein
MSVLTCHTDGCLNQDEPIDMDLDYTDEGGQTQTITDVFCGVCSQPITDIQEGEPDA